MDRKSQAAIEFLMTYGWAILVVLISIGALAYFGVLAPEEFLPQICTLPTSSGLFCNDFSISSDDGTITLRIHNILTDNVDITALSTDAPSCVFSSCTPDPIPKDSLGDCALSCSGGLASKDKVKAALSISYKVGDSSLEKGASGSLIAIVP